MTALESIPHPFTAPQADRLRESPKIREVTGAVIGARLGDGGMTDVLVAFMVVTDATAAAIVEQDDGEGYTLLTRDDSERADAVWDRLQEWCDENGYPDEVQEDQPGDER